MLLAKVIGVGELSVIWVSLNDQLRPAASRAGHREVEADRLTPRSEPLQLRLA